MYDTILSKISILRHKNNIISKMGTNKCENNIIWERESESDTKI